MNAAYVFTWRAIRRPAVLYGVIAASAASLIATACWFGKLDVGFTWTNAWGGVPRVLFSFTLGIALQHLQAVRLIRFATPSWLPVLILAPLLWVKIDPVIYPLICVLVIFPVLVLVAAETRPGPRTVRWFTRLGLASYPLYAIHKPVGEIVSRVLSLHAPWMLHWDVWLGLPYLAALTAISLWLERTYDRPVRRLLTKALNRVIAAIPRRARQATQPAGTLAAEQS